MSSDALADDAPVGRRRRTKRRRLWPRVTLVIVLVVGLICAWLAFRAFEIDRSLRSAQADVDRVRSDATNSDWAALQTDTTQLERHAARAAGATHDPLVVLAAHLWVVGPNLTAVSVVSRELDEVARHAVTPLAASQTLTKIQQHQTKVSTLAAALDADSTTLRNAAKTIATANLTVQAIRTGSLWSPIRSGIVTAQEKLASASEDVTNLATVGKAAPTLLGVPKPQTILLIFQTPDEERGTGGLPGAWGELTAINGSLALADFGPDDDLPTLTSYPAGVSPDIKADYGVDPLLPLNAGLSASFPDAAQLLSASWTAGPGKGKVPDAVVSIDPVALGDFLSVIGPVSTSGGTTITGANAADLLLRQQYYTYGDDQDARVAFLGEVTRAVFARITAGGYSISSLAKQAGQLLHDERLIVWSAEPTQESAWNYLNASGSLGQPALNAARFTLTSTDASKLGAFLHTSLDVNDCTTSAPTLTVKLSNESPATPPAYMATHVKGLAFTTMRLIYSFYIAPQWSIPTLTVDGGKKPFSSDLEGGWRLVRAVVEIPRGASATIVLTLKGTALTASNVRGIEVVKAAPEAFPIASAATDCSAASPTASTS